MEYFYDDLSELCPDDKRMLLSYYPEVTNITFPYQHSYKINSDFLKFNLRQECDREVEVSYWPIFPLINHTTPLDEADYIIYGHFYARFHNFQEEVKSQLEFIYKNKKPDAKIIVVGKSCNVKLFLEPYMDDIIFFESHYAEALGQYFNLPIKDKYFVYDEKMGWLNMWPVDGCQQTCKFCRRSYMHIPFESLPLDLIKENLDWYQKNCPEKLTYVMLRAENLTEYGIDIYGRQTLPELIKLILSYPEVQTVSIMIGLAICEINDEILDALCSSQKFHDIYLNIEAGTNRLLELIGKKHTREKVIEVFRRLREANPNILLHTNVMLGLPTEGIEDIIELAQLVNTVEPTSLYVLRYRNDPGQPLYKYPYMSDQLWAYHLKLFLRLLKQGKRNLPLNVRTIMVPKPHKRKYNREMQKNAKEQEYYYEDVDYWHNIILPENNLERKRGK